MSSSETPSQTRPCRVGRRLPRPPPSTAQRVRMLLLMLASIPFSIWLVSYLHQRYSPWECLVILYLVPMAIAVALLAVCVVCLLLVEILVAAERGFRKHWDKVVLIAGPISLWSAVMIVALMGLLLFRRWVM